MHKLPVVNGKELLKILKNFGFCLDHTTGSHFVLYNKQNKKREVIPYHIKDIPKGTLMNILLEAGINKKDFLEHYKNI